jgi:hypothetical protein
MHRDLRDTRLPAQAVPLSWTISRGDPARHVVAAAAARLRGAVNHLPPRCSAPVLW